MEWTNETTLQFLEAYHAEDVLWDPTHEHHKDKRKLHDAWCRLSTDLNRPLAELKKKKDSLMATFRGHLRKKKASIRSGAGVDDIYKPVWFAYEYMEQFLSPVYEVTQNVNTENPVAEDEVTADDLDEGTEDAPVPMTTQRTPRQVRETPRQEPEKTPSARQQVNSQQTIRRRQNPPELQEAGNQMREAFTMLQNVVSNKTKVNEKEEDECDLYGKILAKKLKKLPEEERELVMYEIDGILLNRRRNLFLSGTIPSRMDSRPSSNASSSTEMSGTTTSPHSYGRSIPHTVPYGINSDQSRQQDVSQDPRRQISPADVLSEALQMTFENNSYTKGYP